MQCHNSVTCRSEISMPSSPLYQTQKIPKTCFCMPQVKLGELIHGQLSLSTVTRSHADSDSSQNKDVIRTPCAQTQRRLIQKIRLYLCSTQKRHCTLSISSMNTMPVSSTARIASRVTAVMSRRFSISMSSIKGRASFTYTTKDKNGRIQIAVL